jgi:hypothetical protein
MWAAPSPRGAARRVNPFASVTTSRPPTCRHAEIARLLSESLDPCTGEPGFINQGVYPNSRRSV